MKTLMITVISATLILFTACSKMDDQVNPVSNSSDKELKSAHNVPIKGESMGYATLVSWNGGPAVHKAFEGTGNISHLGLCSMTLDFTYISLNLDPNASFNGIILPGASGVITAANGDKLFYTADFQGNDPYPHCATYKFGGWTPYPPIPGLNLPTTNDIFPATCTLTGGTGRFENATGSFTYTGYQWDIPLQYPPTLQSYSVPVPTKLSMDGIINYRQIPTNSISQSNQ